MEHGYDEALPPPQGDVLELEAAQASEWLHSWRSTRDALTPVVSAFGKASTGPLLKAFRLLGVFSTVRR